MSKTFAPLVIAASALLQACTVLGGLGLADSADTEAAQLAWNGPGMGPCAFGGVTPRAEDHCAQVRGGETAMLESVNARIRSGLSADASCQEHVEAARAALEADPALVTARLYSCPAASRRHGECHVSLLVTTADSRRLVLDNGAVIDAALGRDGVAPFEVFTRAAGGSYWLDFPPTAQDLAALELGADAGGSAPGQN